VFSDDSMGRDLRPPRRLTGLSQTDGDSLPFRLNGKNGPLYDGEVLSFDERTKLEALAIPPPEEDRFLSWNWNFVLSPLLFGVCLKIFYEPSISLTPKEMKPTAWRGNFFWM